MFDCFVLFWFGFCFLLYGCQICVFVLASLIVFLGVSKREREREGEREREREGGGGEGERERERERERECVFLRLT